MVRKSLLEPLNSKRGT